MTRGRPALWSCVLGLPLIAVGVYVAHFQSSFRLFARELEASPSAGIPLAALGGFVIALGLYVKFVVTPEPLTMRDGETKLETRTPALRHTLAQAAVGLAVLCVGCYLLFYEDYPYVYPTVPLLAGLYVFSNGCYRYWRNTLTRYVVTDRRVVEEYWFLSLVRNEVPFEKVRGVGEHRSAWEALFGVGDVAVRSGADGSLTVGVDDVYESGAFAELIREQLERPDGHGDGTGTPPNDGRGGPDSGATEADVSSEDDGGDAADDGDLVEAPRTDAGG